MVSDETLVRVDINDIPHLHCCDITFKGKCTGILQGVKKDGCYLATQTETTTAFIGDTGDIIAHVPEHGIGR